MRNVTDCNAIEIIKAVAPYVTTAVTIIAVLLTSAMSQRNWLRQFLATRASALADEKRRLLSGVPQALMKAGLHARAALVWLTIWKAVTDAAKQDQFQTTGDLTSRSQDFLDRHSNAMGELHAMWPDLYSLRITVRVYFGDAAGQVFELALRALQKIVTEQPTSETIEHLTKQIVESAEDGSRLIFTPEPLAVLIDGLTPVVKEYDNDVTRLVQIMAQNVEGPISSHRNAA